MSQKTENKNPIFFNGKSYEYNPLTENHFTMETEHPYWGKVLVYEESKKSIGYYDLNRNLLMHFYQVMNEIPKTDVVIFEKIIFFPNEKKYLIVEEKYNNDEYVLKFERLKIGTNENYKKYRYYNEKWSLVSKKININLDMFNNMFEQFNTEFRIGLNLKFLIEEYSNEKKVI